MKARVEVDAGVCGFRTEACAESEDNQHVRFAVTTDCANIQALIARLEEAGAMDAYQEISPAGESTLLTAAREMPPGCCAGCVVPIALFKAMQVAAGLALPRDIHMSLAKE